MFSDVARNLLPQFKQAEIGRVIGLSFLERKDRGFTDMPRSNEIRFAHAERDHVLPFHLGDELEEIADAAFR